jgi:hypothetical protein
MAINLACENNTFGLKITQYLNRFFVHNIIKADWKTNDEGCDATEAQSEYPNRTGNQKI